MRTSPGSRPGSGGWRPRGGGVSSRDTDVRRQQRLRQELSGRASVDHGAEPHFTQPIRQIVVMVVVLALVSVGAWVAWPQVSPVFLANPWLNGFIFLVFVTGIAACFWQVFQLMGSASWIEGFAAQRPGFRFTRAPRLLASLAALLRQRSRGAQINAASARSILDSVATRIDEARDITRYLVNLLIFLGLLGTFYGLATTVPAVVETIRSLAPQGNEAGTAVFGRLMTGLENQLGGMGVAFSSSLLGLAGSLVVGLLELFASHGQNRFYRELEEWLSTITRVSFAAGDEGGEAMAAAGGADGAAIAMLAEHLSERLDMMQAAMAEREQGAPQGDIAAALERLTERLDSAAGVHPDTERMIESQNRLAAAIEARVGDTGGVDTESRMRLRSMDVQMLRILEELSAGRQEMLGDLRADIHRLTRAVRELGMDPVPDDDQHPSSWASE